MGPIVNQLATDYDDKSIRFVTFDFTTAEGKKAAKQIAGELGVARLHAKHAPDSGFALLYDTKNRKVVKRLSASNDTAVWREHIDKVLGDG